MSIVLVRLYPEQLLASMHYLRLIADPRGPREKYIALQNVEEGEEKGLGSRSNDDLVWLDLTTQTARLELCNGLKSHKSPHIQGRMVWNGSLLSAPAIPQQEDN